MTTPSVNRRERKKLTTRKIIRDAALQLFEAHGYTNVTVEQISEAADVSPITFYRHFHTKEGVILSVAMTPELQQAIAAVSVAKTSDEIDSIFTQLFSNSATWTDSFTRRMALIANTPNLIDTLWQYSTRWTDTVAKELPDGIYGRIFARCLICTMIESALAWIDQSSDHDIAELRRITQNSVTPLVLTYIQSQNETHIP